MFGSRLLFRWVVLSLSLVLCAEMLPGVRVDGFFAAIWAALMIGILHWTVRPLLLLVSLPFLILTFGLFLWVINAAVLMLASSLVSGFHIASFGTALWSSLLISLVQWVCDRWWWKNSGPSIRWSVRTRQSTSDLNNKTPKRSAIDLAETSDRHWE